MNCIRDDSEPLINVSGLTGFLRKRRRIGLEDRYSSGARCTDAKAAGPQVCSSKVELMGQEMRHTYQPPWVNMKMRGTLILELASVLSHYYPVL